MLVFYLGVVSTFNSPHIALFHSSACCSLLPQASCTCFVSKPRLAHTRDLAVAHHVPGRVLSRVLERASSASRASLEHTRASCLGTLHCLGLSQLLGACLATVNYRYWRLPSRPWRQLHCSSIPFPFRMTVALREDVDFWHCPSFMHILATSPPLSAVPQTLRVSDASSKPFPRVVALRRNCCS